MPFAPSERLGDGVWKLAGAELAERLDGRAQMMRPYGEDLKIYLHRAPIDMRRGRNGLAALAQEVLKVDPFTGAMFVYVGRRFKALKILDWNRNGFALWSKKIESTEKYHWPRLLQEEVVTLTSEQLNWLLDGYDIWTQPHQMLRYQHVS
jgi:transposase